MEKDKNAQLSASDKIAGFLQKYRIAFLVFIVLIAAGIAGTTVFFIVRDVLEKKAIAAVEVFEQRKNNLGHIEDTGKSAEAEALLNEINAFSPTTFGYAAARSYSLAADIHFSFSEWDKAEENWVKAAKKAPKIYLAPLSLFNAAVAAEEQKKWETSIDYYSQSLEYSGINPAAARARFNIGRIHETLNDKTKAAEAYRDLIEKNSNSNWAKLAQSRIIFLENK